MSDYEINEKKRHELIAQKGFGRISNYPETDLAEFFNKCLEFDRALYSRDIISKETWLKRQKKFYKELPCFVGDTCKGAQ